MLIQDFFIKFKIKFKSIFRNFLSIFLQYLSIIFNYKVITMEKYSFEKVLKFYISRYVYKNENVNNNKFDNNQFAAQKLAANFIT